MIIEVDDTRINIVRRKAGHYLSLTDIVKAGIKKVTISDWLRTKRALEMLGAWEFIHNSDFNYGEFATILSARHGPGSNRFRISVKEWVIRTRSIGLTSWVGRFGGTYAHRDIAITFAGWVDPIFAKWLSIGIRRRIDGNSSFSTYLNA